MQADETYTLDIDVGVEAPESAFWVDHETELKCGLPVSRGSEADDPTVERMEVR